MTRLIDADEVIHEYYKNPSYQQLCKVLNEAPAVEAISVEFLMEYLDINSQKWNALIAEGVKKVIDDWEKENEQNKENTSQTD